MTSKDRKPARPADEISSAVISTAFTDIMAAVGIAHGIIVGMIEDGTVALSLNVDGHARATTIVDSMPDDMRKITARAAIAQVDLLLRLTGRGYADMTSVGAIATTLKALNAAMTVANAQRVTVN
ncbi:hypothetical protein Ppa06_57920 [Planomonospora parontospora subsp. parontospora]|uniref:Uncharacterized protein n=2 Tax=Planomonospora parontospora TaxID=58119 RepID=A0AA37BLT9_9ACTN|nr:hypothetical protein [Planomonospora parontospora]GGK90448.1 hypothetical protein GCM10010126_57390 [Planomonospora parontospora]GII11994.1 hypothetical protein Ppa06_57920 [Planomonospora parontospora subsp. parontospora]